MTLYHKLAFELIHTSQKFLSLFFLLLVAQNITAQTITEPELLQKASTPNGVRVIVQLKVNAQSESTLVLPNRIAAQRNLIRGKQDRIANSLRRFNTQKTKKFQYLPYMATKVNKEGLAELLANPDVAAVFEDKLAKPSLSSSGPVIGIPGAVSQGFTGSGQVVAVLDTGVDRNHAMLSGKVIHEACFSSTVPSRNATTLCPNGQDTQTGTGASAPCASDCAHGTHVAAIAAGNGNGLTGAARDAQVMGIQVFTLFNSVSVCGDSGTPCALSYNSDQIAGLEHVYSQRNNFNIAAVNMSLGGGQFFSACDTNPTKAAIDLLRSAGIATIIASGNESFINSIGAPACISTAISVGATNDSDRVANFSNSAQILDLLAPGVSITSAVPGTGLATLNGTSMATPQVAGAFAVMRQKSNSASIDTILNHLKNTGIPVIDSRNNIEKPRIKLDQALLALGGTTQNGNINVTPSVSFNPSGPVGGNFSPLTQSYTITNTGSQSLQFNVIENVSWLSVNPASGTLSAGSSANISINMTSVANNLSNGTFNTSVTFNNITTGQGNTSRAISLTVTALNIANDKFIDSIPLIQSSGSTTGTNINATKENGEPNHSDNTGGKSVWWNWTASSSGKVTFDTEGSNFDTLMASYVGSSVGSLAPIMSNDDANGGLQSQITFDVQSGTTYYIAVDGFSATSGQVMLNWSFTPDISAPLPLGVTPNENFVINGASGGPYTPGIKTYTLTNFNAVSKSFQITGLPNWLIASETSGTLAASESIDITLSINSNANGLNPGIHNAGILFNATTRLAQITISNSSQSNDLFTNAQVLSGLPISTIGTNFNTKKETGEPHHANNLGGKSVWWRWTAPTSGFISVDTFGSNFDTILGFYIGNQVNNLTAIASSDDTVNAQSQVVTKVIAGKSYYIAIDGYNGASGSIILNITPSSSTGTPNNDDFGNATIITGIPNISAGTNASATKQVGEVNHANNSGGKSVWWVWSSPVSQEVTIATFGSNFDTLLGIYTGNQVNSLTTIGSNDDATNFSTQSAVTFTPTKGVTYYIGVDGYSGDSGTISLNISSTVPVNFPLQVTTIGNGTVISDISGINCPTKCSESYPSGTSLLLAASADDRWVFSGWSGDCTGIGVCSLTMLVERNVTATFTSTPLLSVFKTGIGSGFVSSSPSGISCGSDCSNTYTVGTRVNLTATPNSGSIFQGWTGPCTGTRGCSFNLNTDTSVTALFGLNDNDSDGIPDIQDPDDDNDGLSDEDELARGRNPKVNEAALFPAINLLLLD